MLIKPDIQDATIITCLQREFGLRIVQLAFLPLGADLMTAVYRADAVDGTPYFCKLRRGDFDDTSVELPRFLSEEGIAEIIPPLLTKTGRLWAELGEFMLILYPFVEGINGFEIELVESQWAAFGAALKRIHTTTPPPDLRRKIQMERYSAEWRDTCRNVIQRLENETFTDPIMLDFAKFMGPRLDSIRDLLGHSERLAHKLSANSPEFVVCHSDIHPGNLFIDKNGTLFIIDWDYPLLAPKERDLMFIGGGQGYMATTALKEETLFYRYYGPPMINPAVMAYYRCERNLIDLCVESARIFSSTLNDQDRAHSLQIVTWLFLPESSIDMAYKAIDILQRGESPKV